MNNRSGSKIKETAPGHFSVCFSLHIYFTDDKKLIWSIDKADASLVRQMDTTNDLFIIQPNTLEPNAAYTVSVTDPDDSKVKASYDLSLAETLQRGTCVIYPNEGKIIMPSDFIKT